jgi:hypothetical protein
MALRELGDVTLHDALDYLALLAQASPDRFDRTAIRRHGRLETESATLTLAEAQLALAALGSFRILRRAQPTLHRRIG